MRVTVRHVLKSEIERPREEVNSLKGDMKTQPRFSVGTIKGDDDLVLFYTGLPSYDQFCALTELLGDCSSSIPTWGGNTD